MSDDEMSSCFAILSPSNKVDNHLKGFFLVEESNLFYRRNIAGSIVWTYNVFTELIV